MSKNITEMGYTEKSVISGRFFDLDNVMTLEEMAEQYGEYDEKWRKDDEQLLEAFRGAGYEFIGCVNIKKGFDGAMADACVYYEGGYIVRGGWVGQRKRNYVVVDVWDETHGQGEVRAYRFNLFTAGSFDYNEVNKIYKQWVKEQEG